MIVIFWIRLDNGVYTLGTALILPSLINATKQGVKVKIITRDFYDKKNRRFTNRTPYDD